MAKKPAIPRISPREPLTKKARAAIGSYVMWRCKGVATFGQVMDLTLRAERMPRERLYLMLLAAGFKWNCRLGIWSKKGGDKKQKS